MTATEKLRHMLDERGVEYEVEREGKLSEAVLWDGPIGTKHSAFVSNENPDKATGEILYSTLFLTPEQAVAATVGTSTCRLKKGATAWLAEYNGYITEWTCDECGGLTFYDAETRPRFCTDCGRRVVE